jgi:hypothetical protein
MDSYPLQQLNPWRLYEACLGSHHKEKRTNLPHSSLEEYLPTDFGGVCEQHSLIRKDIDRSKMVSKVLSLIASLLYGIARIALLVIAFSSLRSVPEALYTESRTRFIANIE